jgi:CRP-like cAMP-binding protein
MTLRADQTIEALDIAQKVSIFQGTTPEQRVAIVTVLDFKSLVAGKVILMEKEISKTIYILAQGSVGIWQRKNNQKEQLAILRAPDFFGEISMFSDKPANALVKTEEASHFFLLPLERYDALVAQDPALGELIQRNIQAHQRASTPKMPPQLPEL